MFRSCRATAATATTTAVKTQTYVWHGTDRLGRPTQGEIAGTSQALVKAQLRKQGIAAKTVKESTYHLEHATLWTLRLGDGTEESHRRMQQAVDEIWPYTYELFDDNALRQPWLNIVEPVLAEATLTRPEDPPWAPRGGRQGLHTEHLSYLLAEMQVLHRAHPGAQW